MIKHDQCRQIVFRLSHFLWSLTDEFFKRDIPSLASYNFILELQFYLLAKHNMKRLIYTLISLHHLIVVSWSQLLPVTAPTLRGNLSDCFSFQEIKKKFESFSADVLAKLKNIPQGGEGLWKEIVYLNMSDPEQQCPSGWQLHTTPRSCTQL